MSKIHRSAVLVAASLALAAAGASTASADAVAPTVCDGSLSNVVVGDVSVPYGTDCTLTNVLVDGSVTTEPDAGAVSLRSTVVTGDVATQSLRLELRGAIIGGDLSATDTAEGIAVTRSAVSGTASFVNTATELKIGDLDSFANGNVFGGSLSIATTFGPATVGSNAVVGNLLVRDGRAKATVGRNLVGGALDCSGSVPAPTGSANLAGSKLGQCAAL